MRYYRGIDDLPIWNFEKISETGDIRFMLRLDDYFDLPEKGFDFDKLVDTYIDISDQLFERFGLDDKAITKMLELKDLLIAKLRWLSGEKSQKSIYSIKNKIIEQREELTQGKKQTFDERIVLLETYFKKDFDVQRMSVAKFYTYLNLYKQSNK